MSNENPVKRYENTLALAAVLILPCTVDGLWDRIGNLIDRFTPQECANYFAAAGYDAT